MNAAATQAVNDSEINDATFDLVVRATDDETPTAAFAEDTVTVTITDDLLAEPTLSLIDPSDGGVLGDDLTNDITPTLEIGALDDDIMSVTLTDDLGNILTDFEGDPAIATRADIHSPWIGSNNGLNPILQLVSGLIHLHLSLMVNIYLVLLLQMMEEMIKRLIIV